LKHCLIDTTNEYLSANRNVYDPGKLDLAVLEAVAGVIKKWMDLLGCTGKA
jgi:hypothetical protein